MKSVFFSPFQYLKKSSEDNTIIYIVLGIVLIPVLALKLSSNPTISYVVYGIYFALIWAIILYKLIGTKQTNIKTALSISLLTIPTTGLIYLFHGTSVWTIIKDNLYSSNLILSFFSMLIGVAMIEELIKQIFVYYVIYKNRNVTLPRTAIFYGMIAGLTFGVYEGIEYQLGFNKTLDSDDNYFLNIIRLTSLPFFHAIWAGIGAYFASLSFIELKFKYSFRIMGLIIPSILHALYNIFEINLFGVSVIIISSLIFIVYLTKSDLVGKNLNNI